MSMDPLSQFQINRLYEFGILDFDLSLTQSAVVMLFSSLFLGLLFFFGLNKPKLVPSKFQLAVELLYGFIANMVLSSMGNDGKKYIPLIATLFLYIGFMNLIGMFMFSPTSHISLTIAMGTVVFAVCIAISVRIHRTHVLSIFIPSGVPMIIKPLIFVIEFFSYCSRPISLGMRLAANIIAGHVMLAVIASFTYSMGVFGFVPILVVVALAIFECGIGLLQAYIFSILSTTYISQAVHPDH